MNLLETGLGLCGGFFNLCNDEFVTALWYADHHVTTYVQGLSAKTSTTDEQVLPGEEILLPG